MASLAVTTGLMPKLYNDFMTEIKTFSEPALLHQKLSIWINKFKSFWIVFYAPQELMLS
jgi:hypothetical protein